MAADAPEPTTLEAAMARCVAGDVRGFEEIYRRMGPRVAAMLRALWRDARLADDLAQATFLKVYRARDAYRRDALVEPWVFAIARRTWIDHTRHRRRRPESVSADGELPERVDGGDSPAAFEVLGG